MTSPTIVLHTRGAPRLLRAVLKSLARQRSDVFEVLVADDGDTRISRDVVREFGLMYPDLPIRHVVHAPPSTAPLPLARGEVLLEAFEAVATDYTIFIGTGTLVHPDFVATHMRLRGEQRALVAPRGVVVKSQLVRQLLDARSSCRGDLGWLARHALRGNLAAPSRGVIVRAPWLRRWLSPSEGTLEGGHFSLSTAVLRQLLADTPPVAGAARAFDEHALGARLAALGVETFDISRLAVTYHLEGYAFAAAEDPDAATAAGAGARIRRRGRTRAVSAPVPASTQAAAMPPVSPLPGSDQPALPVSTSIPAAAVGSVPMAPGVQLAVGIPDAGDLGARPSQGRPRSARKSA